MYVGRFIVAEERQHEQFAESSRRRGSRFQLPARNSAKPVGKRDGPVLSTALAGFFMAKAQSQNGSGSGREEINTIRSFMCTG